MTTIAYKDGVIAVDSRCTRDNTIVSDSYNKIKVVQDVQFILCGVLSEEQAFISAYFGEEPQDEIEMSALVVHQNRVYSVVFDQGKIYKLDITGSTDAMGSGEDHALTAMDLGLSAKEAVRMAAKRDTGTGGRIRVLEVK